MTDQSSGEPRKAYTVIEASRGETIHLVYASSIREIREYWPNVERETIEWYNNPAGIRAVHRQPEDDR